MESNLASEYPDPGPRRSGKRPHRSSILSFRRASASQTPGAGRRERRLRRASGSGSPSLARRSTSERGMRHLVPHAIVRRWPPCTRLARRSLPTSRSWAERRRLTGAGLRRSTTSSTTWRRAFTSARRAEISRRRSSCWLMAPSQSLVVTFEPPGLSPRTEGQGLWAKKLAHGGGASPSPPIRRMLPSRNRTRWRSARRASRRRSRGLSPGRPAWRTSPS